MNTLRNVKTHKLLLLAEGDRTKDFTSGCDYTFGYGFYGGLKNVFCSNSAATSLDDYTFSDYSEAMGTQQPVRFTTNHEVNDSDGTPVDLFGGKAGAMSAFVVAACYRGIPFVYDGQEAGMTQKILSPFTIVKVAFGAHPDVTRAYPALLQARASSAALYKGTATSYSSTDVCTFSKVTSAETAVVLANVHGRHPGHVPRAFGPGWHLTSLLRSGAAVTLGTSYSLPAYGYVVPRK